MGVALLDLKFLCDGDLPNVLASDVCFAVSFVRCSAHGVLYDIRLTIEFLLKGGVGWGIELCTHVRTLRGASCYYTPTVP